MNVSIGGATRQRSMRSHVSNVWHRLSDTPRTGLCGFEPVVYAVYTDVDVKITCKRCVQKISTIYVRKIKAKARLIAAQTCEHSLDEVCYPCRFARLPREPTGWYDIRVKLRILAKKIEARDLRMCGRIGMVPMRDSIVFVGGGIYHLRTGGGTRRTDDF